MTVTPPPPHPRIRIGAILYGLVVAASSIGLLAISADPALRTRVVETTLGLAPGAVVALVIAAFGAIALLIGLAHLLDRRSAREAERTAPEAEHPAQEASATGSATP